MRVAFRADSSRYIGSGHVMRCLALAEGLRLRGADVLFICRDLPGNLNHVVVEKGFDLCCLHEPAAPSSGLEWNKHAAWLGVDWKQDADETLAALQSNDSCYDWLIIDHYAIDKNWEEIVKPSAEKVMVIDDLADRQHDCDLILDQNYYLNPSVRYKPLISERCKQLLGPAYALLRPEFSKSRKIVKERDGRVANILVFFGGVDSTNETVKALNAISSLDRENLEVDVIIGSGNTHQHEIHELCKEQSNVRVHCQISNMSDLMVKADLAIGAGGTVTWERFCLGLPSIVLSVADNQQKIAKDCGMSGLQLYLGTYTEVTQDILSAALSTVLQSPALLMSFSAQSMNVVDGKGLERVLQYLCPLNIDLREAELSDCQKIFAWRNAEETRRHIFDKEEISYEVHQNWFEKSLVNADRIILIGEINQRPVGVLRYDLNGQDALISIYLVPGEHPPGCGTQLIRAGSFWLKENRPEIKRIYAEILEQNVASVKAFEKAGYHHNHLTFCDELYE